MRRVLRATAALAHAEGGAALRQLCGLQRLLDAARTYLAPNSGGSTGGSGGGGGGGGGGGAGGVSLRSGMIVDKSALEVPLPPPALSTLPVGGLRNASVADKLSLMDELMLTAGAYTRSQFSSI